MDPVKATILISCKLKILLVSFLLMAVTKTCFCQVTNLAPGLWSNIALWSNSQLPGSNDSVYLSYDITIDISATCKALNTNGHNVTVNPGVSFYILNGPIDIDGHVYTALAYCNNLWTKENLGVAHYRNGDTIPQVTDHNQWLSLTTGAWCYYNNDPANGATYGKLYNWYAVHDPRGITPAGWHIPSDNEWTTLVNCLGDFFTSGGAMKEAGIIHWADPNSGATNSSGFTGLPGGTRVINGGPFDNLSTYGYFWSSTEADMTNAWLLTLTYNGPYTNLAGFDKRLGLSVRCIKD